MSCVLFAMMKNQNGNLNDCGEE